MIKIHLQNEDNAQQMAPLLPVTTAQAAPITLNEHDIVPQVFFLELTNNCNMHCTFCPSDYLKKGRRMADDELAIRFIEQVRDLNVKRPIQFSVLGEPLLNKKIYKYIDLCERYEIEVYLITNFAILDAARARSLFHHHNLALVLSLQTPTADSYDRLRGYNKLTFEQYFDRILPALREKFSLGSRSRVEIHVTSTSNMRADAAIQSDFDLDMWDPFSIENKETFVHDLLNRFDDYARQLQAEFPEQFDAEHARSMRKYAPQLDTGHLAASRGDVPADAVDLTEERFWGYMFAPNCFIRFKTFGLWTKEASFMQTFLPKESMVYVEERVEALDCAMAHNVSMLADGQLSLCCLDYEGEMALPNLKDTSVSELLRLPKRMAIAKDAMQTEVCRRCQGNMFVFDTQEQADADVPITKFGRGWHPYEADLNGTGGRWSNGHAFLYYYARTDGDQIALRFLSVHDSNAVLRAEVRQFDPATKEFGAPTEHPFHGGQNEMRDVVLPAHFATGTLYRIDLISPTFVPAQANGSADQRTLGLALLEARIQLRPPQPEAQPEAQPQPPSAPAAGRLRRWLNRLGG